MTGINYSDSTPDVTYSYYTSGTNKIGRLQSVSSSTATETFSSYDAPGRVLSHTQEIAGNSYDYTLGYTYRLDDSIATMTYPSGRVMTYSVDDAGRTETITDGTTVFADMDDLATSPEDYYDPAGRVINLELGNSLWEAYEFRPAGTETKFKLGTAEGGSQRLQLGYNYDSTYNNGNLSSHVITHPGPTTYTQSFSYDGVNRLSSASESSGFSRTFGYDQYGNRWVATSSGVPDGLSEPGFSSNFDAYNQINVDDSDHDAAGNQIHFAYFDVTFDAGNRITSMISDEPESDDTAYFAYDGNGQRVGKSWEPDGGSQIVTYYIYL